MVTKQQQLEWLAENHESWPYIGPVMIMSDKSIGVYYGAPMPGCQFVSFTEWRQERDKMQKQAAQASQPAQPAQPAQQKPDNSWHERGEFPPAGCECEAFADGCEPEACTILAIHNGTAAVKWSKFNNGGLDVITLNGWSFRPLRTEREKAIDEMSLLAIGCEINAETIGAIYDAGYRKVKP